MKKINIRAIQKYVVFFYVYAFLGWIVDVSIRFVSDGNIINSVKTCGFLYEPICPMYGYAALVLILLSKSKRISGRGGFIKKTILATIWCSVLEYLTAFVLWHIFHQQWWDYSNEPYNIQGRICLAASLLWGVLSVLFMKVIHPFVERQLRRIANKVSTKWQRILIWVAVAITVADTILSIIFRYI